ncbi:glycosyltransferase family protein [Botrimarina hoheduenensis]|uniref:MurG-like transferase n=1 Tax=Botrimarina hoheduenensis TaxID=2528000 RepID=A0A5C5VSW4_9BACT|nr:glycosyltransferase family protein [Botrimarina hoheduenensis]TWT40821.1 hypothetical protein Pla111_32390 [Botrimarina hoheduenensis]
MPTIFYSVMGEGRGHAARARAMVERLRDRHRVVLFSSADGYEFLESVFGNDPEIDLHAVPGLVFHYTEGKLDQAKTIREGAAFWLNANRSAQDLLPLFRSELPALAICDFEPLLPRAARRAGVPLVSLDHQHFMSTYDLTSLPARLQRWAWRMSWATWAFGINAQTTVVSAFYQPPLRRGYEHVVQVSTLLRDAVRHRTPTFEGPLLSYLRRATPPRVIETLAALPRPVRIYGLGERPPQGAATFHAIDETTFVDDLASCEALISAAGNQLLGEALHLGKPILALPERNHHEQCINACFLEQLGGGEWSHIESVTSAAINGFLERIPAHRERIQTDARSYDGLPKAVEAVEQALANATRRS